MCSVVKEVKTVELEDTTFHGQSKAKFYRDPL